MFQRKNNIKKKNAWMLKGKENTLQGFTIPRTITCRGCSQKTEKNE